MQHSFGSLSNDLGQRLLDALLSSNSLSLPTLRCLSHCSIEDLCLDSYMGVTDDWLSSLRPHAASLRHLDFSFCSDISDQGLLLLSNCPHLRSIFLNMCPKITDQGLAFLEGCKELRQLSCEGCLELTGKGLLYLSGLSSLSSLSLQMCSSIRSGLHHLQGLSQLQSLNVGWCFRIEADDASALASLTNLKSLSITGTPLSKNASAFLQELQCLSHLEAASCDLHPQFLHTLKGLPLLTHVNVGRANLSGTWDASMLQGFSGIRVLNLAYANLQDSTARYLSRLVSLEELVLESCSITDSSMDSIAALSSLRLLDISETTVGDEGVARLADGLLRMESLNLSYSAVSDAGLRDVGRMKSLTSLNLDTRLVSDSGLAFLTGLRNLRRLDCFGARVTDAGFTHLRHFNKLEFLEVCGGGVTDVGLKELQPLTTLTSLNLSQNLLITDKGLPFLSGLHALRELNVSRCRVSAHGLRSLGGLSSLSSLAIHSCSIPLSSLSRLRSSSSCLWPSDLTIRGAK